MCVAVNSSAEGSDFSQISAENQGLQCGGFELFM
jgi:hypothetical protein